MDILLASNNVTQASFNEVKQTWRKIARTNTYQSNYIGAESNCSVSLDNQNFFTEVDQQLAMVIPCIFQMDLSVWLKF